MADDLLGKTIGGIGNLGKQLGKGVADETKKSAVSVKQQIGFEAGKDKEKGAEKPLKVQNIDNQKQQQEAKDNEDLKRMLYGKSEEQASVQPEVKKEEKSTNPAANLAQSLAEKHPDKTPEEIQKMVQLHQQLHKEDYYNPTFNRLKKEEQENVEEEKKQEEEQKKMGELHEKKKKDKEEEAVLHRKQTTVETNRGVSG
ncbi:MAG: hypothetical protein Q8P80_01500 [Candidatus Levybacteria bacterium]|nr:hypothetical protein [Candidatus Levybacteria bacterium]